MTISSYRNNRATVPETTTVRYITGIARASDLYEI